MQESQADFIQEVNEIPFTFQRVDNWLAAVHEHFSPELYLLTLVEMGRVNDFPDHKSITEAAYPCLAGAAIKKSGSGIFVFHFFGTTPPNKLISLINNDEVYGGVVGGYGETYNFGNNSSLLGRCGIRYLPSNDPSRQSFAIMGLPDKRSVLYSYEKQR